MFTISHYSNGRCVYHAQCTDEADAINLANQIVSETFENGQHNVFVYDLTEETSVYESSFIVEDAEVNA